MYVYIENLWIFEDYTILQWALFFILYCMLGWVFESIYCSIKEQKLLNRGFCHGPWLPIYGSGAILMLVFAGPFKGEYWKAFLTGMLVGSALELVTGYLMFHIFHMRWWDYSQNPLNFHGYICLYTSIAWGALAVVFIEFIHPRFSAISKDWTYTGFVVAVTMLYTLFIEDVIFSVIGALDLKKRLENLAANSEEIQALKLNISEAKTKFMELQEQAKANVSEVKSIAETEGNLAAAKAVRLKLHSLHMTERLRVLEDGGDEKSGRMNWWVASMLRNNPTLKGGSESFEKLREAAGRYKEGFQKIEALIEKEFENLRDEHIDEME